MVEAKNPEILQITNKRIFEVVDAVLRLLESYYYILRWIKRIGGKNFTA
jgi:hypothetical protein